MLKSIHFKLFLSFLITTLLVVVGMYGFIIDSFHDGFSEFMESRQQERVNSLIGGLTERYAHDQSWNNLADNKQKWIRLLRESSHHPQSYSWNQQLSDEPNEYWPPQLPPELDDKEGFTPFEYRVMLLDANKNTLYGRDAAAQKNMRLLPIQFQDTVVGYLGLLPGKAINHSSEIAFIERQSNAFIGIALVMLGLSASLAWLLAYAMGHHLKRFTSAAQALAIGKYDTRLPVESRDELGQLARDFNELAAALEQSEQARRRWVADISHELRTPLAVLRGELEALQDGIRPLTAAAIDSLMTDVMRLNRLTEDLYQLSLSDQGALSYRKSRINPVELLQENSDAFNAAFAAKDISIQWIKKIPVPVKVYADPDRLSQLFRNILKNSLNYTDAHGQLIITVSRSHHFIRFGFSDSAPGVAEEDIGKLFQRFYRVDTLSDRHRQGAGLGLAICANIVKAHDGTINAAQSPMHGLSIQIEFPIAL